MGRIFPPRVLVAYERSGVVAAAFRRQGFSAWSCDIEPADHDNGYHLQMDAIDAIRSDWWDLVIAHPECTALTVSGNHVYAVGKPRHHERLAAIAYVDELWRIMTSEATFAALENPKGVLPTWSTLPRPIYIQPHDFGHDASKSTGLFLHNLDPLVPTCRVPGRLVNGVERWANQTDSGQNRLGPSPTRAAERARTYEGIADAMALRWREALWLAWL